MNGYYLAQQETSSTYRVMAFKNAAIAQAYIAANRLRNVRPASQAHGRKLGAVEDLRDYIPDASTWAKEAQTMTTTTAAHTAASRLDPRPAAAAPAPQPQKPTTTNLPHVGQTSAALEEVRALRAEVQALRADMTAAYDSIAYLRDLVMRQHAEIKETLARLVEGRSYDNIHKDETSHVLDRIIDLLEAQPAATGTRVCKIHGVAMPKKEKNGQTWYSHRNEKDGSWCRGK